MPVIQFVAFFSHSRHFSHTFFTKALILVWTTLFLARLFDFGGSIFWVVVLRREARERRHLPKLISRSPCIWFLVGWRISPLPPLPPFTLLILQNMVFKSVYFLPLKLVISFTDLEIARLLRRSLSWFICWKDTGGDRKPLWCRFEEEMKFGSLSSCSWIPKFVSL